MMILLWVVVSAVRVTLTAEVSVTPDEYVSTPGGRAVFTCQTSGVSVVDVQWLVNGTELDSLNLTNVRTILETAGTRKKGRLVFTQIPVEYNTTTVNCIAMTMNENLTADQNSTLLIQGLLSSVIGLQTNITNSTIFLTWMAPFSLTIVGDNIGIIYVVDVVNSTTLLSRNVVNVTEFSHPIPPDIACYEYVLTVSPVNVVGTGMPYTWNFSQIIGVPEVEEVTCKHPNSCILTMSTAFCQLELTLVDIDTGNKPKVVNLTTLGDGISFTVDHLSDNHLYNMTVIATNIKYSTTSGIRLSTHDVMNISVTEAENGVNLEVQFFEGSTARGALFLFVFIGMDVQINLNRSFFLALDRDSFLNYTTYLFPGQYRVYAYDIEHNGLLSSSGVGYPAVTIHEVNIENGDYIIIVEEMNCTLNSSNGLISVSMCMDSNNTSGFQVIAQLSNASEVQKLFINQSMDPHTPVTVEVERDGLYQVTIFPIREGRGILDSDVKYCTEQVMVVISNRTTMITTSTITTGSTSGITLGTHTDTKSSVLFTVAIAGGVATLLLISLILVTVVILVVVCYINPKRKKWRPTTDLNTYTTTEELSVYKLAPDK